MKFYSGGLKIYSEELQFTSSSFAAFHQPQFANDGTLSYYFESDNSTDRTPFLQITASGERRYDTVCVYGLAVTGGAAVAESRAAGGLLYSAALAPGTFTALCQPVTVHQLY